MKTYSYELMFKYNEQAETAFKGTVVPMISGALEKLTINEYDWFHHEGKSHCNFEVTFGSDEDRTHFDKAVRNFLRAQRMVARKVKNSVTVVENADK